MLLYFSVQIFSCILSLDLFPLPGSVRIHSRCPAWSHHLRSNWGWGQRSRCPHTGTSSSRLGNRLYILGKRGWPKKRTTLSLSRAPASTATLQRIAMQIFCHVSGWLFKSKYQMCWLVTFCHQVQYSLSHNISHLVSRVHTVLEKSTFSSVIIWELASWLAGCTPDQVIGLGRCVENLGKAFYSRRSQELWANKDWEMASLVIKVKSSID